MPHPSGGIAWSPDETKLFRAEWLRLFDAGVPTRERAASLAARLGRTPGSCRNKANYERLPTGRLKRGVKRGLKQS